MKRSAIVIVVMMVGLAHAQQAPQAPDAAKRRDWSEAMHHTPLPKAGCFEANYPATAWHEIPCVKPPNILLVPRRGPRPFTIGNTNDVSAQAPSGTITQAIGTFDSVSGVTSESSPIANMGASVTDAYTLQVNTNPMTSTACSGSPNPGCQGWEQFVFFNNGTTGGSVFIQYWLLRYNTTCPTGWSPFSFTGSTDIYCVHNAPMSASTPNEPISNLANLSLSGSASSTGDGLSFSDGTIMRAISGDNSVGAASGWLQAEFNVFGAGGNNSGGGAATFNSGAQIVPRTRIFYGGTAAPLCFAAGFTGETNNLNFGPTAPAVGPPGPAVFFTESTAGGATSACAAASSIGDTHLTTVQGLFYDFQASGDFVLAEAEQDFAVQVRQVSGAPTWPNATVNHGVAARLGKTTVAVCLGGEAGARLFVDGKPFEVSDQPRLAADDVTVGKLGNSYIIASDSGNSVRADVNATWINVYVGFAHDRKSVRGLIANANDNVNQIAARDGAVLTNAFPFADLYHHFADSWRVGDKDSLLAPCGPGTTAGAPSGTFYAQDLEPAVRQHAQGVCTAAGVKPGALFDACTLDVAVLGTDKAAPVFTTLPPPAAVGTITGGGVVGGGGGGGGGKHGGLPWWVWLLIALVMLIVVLLVLARGKKHP